MKLIVNSILGSTVRFSSDVGTAIAGWRGPEPQIEHEFDVELDIDCELDRSNTSVITDSAQPRLTGDGETVEIIAKVEHVWDDGMHFLRLTDSCTIMVECKPGTCRTGDCIRVNLPVAAFTVTPIGS